MNPGKSPLFHAVTWASRTWRTDSFTVGPSAGNTRRQAGGGAGGGQQRRVRQPECPALVGKSHALAVPRRTLAPRRRVPEIERDMDGSEKIDKPGFQYPHFASREGGTCAWSD